MSETLFFFELSGEHPTLPGSEALACSYAECDHFRTVSNGPGYLILSFDEKYVNGIAKRIALTHRIGAYLGSTEIGSIESFSRGLSLPDGTFAVRAKRFEGKCPDIDLIKLASKVGGKCWVKEKKIDLSAPEVELRIFASDRLHFYLNSVEIDRSGFEERKVAKRPFFSPISLHPRYARTLVNLTRVKVGQRLLDPFCGTGGVLIEAASIGVKAIGSDISPKMVEGCKENLKHFDLGWERIEVSDIGDIERSIGRVDCVATDPPYGRATSTMKEPLGDLYKRAFSSMTAVLGPGSGIGVVLPRECPPHPGLELREHHDQKVHRSLTRHYCIFSRD